MSNPRGVFCEGVEVKMRRLKTRLFELNKFYSMAELATLLGLSQSYLYRVKHGERGINEKLIVGALTAFPKRKFDDLFYLG